MKEIIIAVLENLTWPIFIALVGYFVLFKHRDALLSLLSRTGSIKVGSFALDVKNAAQEAGTLDFYDKLPELTLTQLHLFLVVGGEGGEQTTYTNKVNPVEMQNAWKKLSALGLIEYAKKPRSVVFKNTEEGKKLHKIIMDQLYKGIVIQKPKTHDSRSA
ncbi:MAG: hypothetical protein ACYTEK_03545 [Planctomycetota bacterium]|jgi:hypothetical protein